jgi:hypothetical protein
VLAKLRPHLTYANCMATAAVFIALGGSSYAAIQVTGKTVKDASLTGKDIRDRSLLRGDFRRGQVPAGPPGAQGETGVKGEKGDKGDPGAPGADATRLWAVINADATTGVNSGVTSSARTSGAGVPGAYEVIFDRDVSNCSYQVTLTARGEATAQPRAGNVNGVFVSTFGSESTGAGVDQRFHLAVFC